MLTRLRPGVAAPAGPGSPQDHTQSRPHFGPGTSRPVHPHLRGEFLRPTFNDPGRLHAQGTGECHSRTGRRPSPCSRVTPGSQLPGSACLRPKQAATGVSRTHWTAIDARHPGFRSGTVTPCRFPRTPTQRSGQSPRVTAPLRPGPSRASCPAGGPLSEWSAPAGSRRRMLTALDAPPFRASRRGISSPGRDGYPRSLRQWPHCGPLSRDAHPALRTGPPEDFRPRAWKSSRSRLPLLRH